MPSTIYTKKLMNMGKHSFRGNEKKSVIAGKCLYSLV